MGRQNEELSVVRVPAYSYIHVIDKNTNITRLEIGPQVIIIGFAKKYHIF